MKRNMHTDIIGRTVLGLELLESVPYGENRYYTRSSPGKREEYLNKQLKKRENFIEFLYHTKQAKPTISIGKFFVIFDFLKENSNILALSSKKSSEALPFTKEILGEILNKGSEEKNFNLSSTEKAHAIEIMDQMKEESLKNLRGTKSAESKFNIFQKGKHFFSSLAKSDSDSQKTKFVEKYIESKQKNTEQQNQR